MSERGPRVSPGPQAQAGPGGGDGRAPHGGATPSAPGYGRAPAALPRGGGCCRDSRDHDRAARGVGAEAHTCSAPHGASPPGAAAARRCARPRNLHGALLPKSAFTPHLLCWLWASCQCAVICDDASFLSGEKL